LRRLLVFGTGAAVIGIVLLIVAFYEAYLIVSTLQREVGNQLTNTNLLLEDATLEAVFLGVMAALGYGLVAKGLDGIRRQELLEMEGPATVYGREQVQIREGRTQYGPRSGPPVGFSTKVEQEKPRDMHPGIKARDDKSVPYEVPVMPAPWSPEPETREEVDTSPAAPAPTFVEPVEVVQDAVPSSSAPTPSDTSTLTVPESSTSGQSTVPEGSSGQSAEWHPEAAKQGEVVWEGQAPPVLGGVEVLPAPESHGAAAALEPQPSQPGWTPEQQPVQAGTEPLVPPKRRRGRPKGSKSAKKSADEPTTSNTT
jgi:hypothetical protein